MKTKSGLAVTIPQLYLVAPRSLFRSDAEWLVRIDRAVAAASAIAQVDVAIQIRIEAGSETSPQALAEAAGVTIAGRIPAFLNAAGITAGGYDGVHLPERRIRPGGHAASVHSLQALRRAEAAGVHFVVFGPVWQPSWKEAQAVGQTALQRICSAARVPVLAIGGVTPERVGACLAAGAHGVAVASAVLAHAEPKVALKALVHELVHCQA